MLQEVKIEQEAENNPKVVDIADVRELTEAEKTEISIRLCSIEIDKILQRYRLTLRVVQNIVLVPIQNST